MTTTAMMSQTIRLPRMAADISLPPARRPWVRRGSPLHSALGFPDRFEFCNLIGNGAFDRKALHRRCPVETVATAGARQDIGGVVRLGDRSAVHEDEDIVLDRERRLGHRVGQCRTVF